MHDYRDLFAEIAALEALGLPVISGGSGQDTATFQEALKTVYEGQNAIELIHDGAPLAQRFKQKDGKQYAGGEMVRPLKINRTQGVGAAAEMGALPQAGRVRFAKRVINMKYLYARVQFSKQVLALSASDRGAYVDAATLEMDDALNNLANEAGRMIWGDGTGKLALVNDTTPTGSALVGVDSPGGFAGATNGARFINDGMVLGAINPATGALRSGNRTVQSVAADGTSVTFDSAPTTWADNDYLVRVNGTAATDSIDSAYQKEPMGLAGLVDDATFVATLFGVNRTTVPLWNSTAITNIGAWSSDVMQRLIDVTSQVGGAQISELWMHQSGRRAYIDTMKDDRRYTSSDLMAPDSGTRAAAGKKMTFGTLPIEEDRFAPYGYVFALSPEAAGFERYELDKGSWINEDGNVLKILGTGSSLQDAFEAVYRVWYQNTIEKPVTCGRASGLDVSVAVAHIY